MNKQLGYIRRFLYGQHFADGLRMAVLIIIPALIASYFGYFDIGLTMSIGALCVSITDTPGPARHKRNAMLLCSAFILVISVLTGFLRMNVYVMGAALTVFAFFFAMFTMYGARAGMLGTAVLLLMVLQIDKELSPVQILENSLFLTAGALWYSLLSIFILQLFPLWSAKRALGECIRETAAYLALRGSLYNNAMPLDEVFQRLIELQVILNEKQNEVRDLLFKNKLILSQSTPQARAMVLTLDEVIDLYEKISASHIEYSAIRERYAQSEVLHDIDRTISQLADILDRTGAAIQSNIPLKEKTDIAASMRLLTAEINEITKDEAHPVLDSLLINIQNMYRVVTDLQHYFTEAYPVLDSPNRTLEHGRFVSHQNMDLSLFRFNLSLHSLTFRHSVRMAVACLAGFILSKLITQGHHSYWILITIIFVLKPAFSLTRERNIQRLTGTLIGGLLGVLILILIHSTAVLFVCMFIAMPITYSFQRHKYLVAVIFMTPYILILFHFMHVGLLEVAEERVLDTVIGSAIALLAGFLILPDWESDQIRKYLSAMLQSNYRYLRAVRDSIKGIDISGTEYKLIRKDVYVSTSNLSAALQRMRSEPTRTQRHTREIQKFSILNHILSSRIASAKESLSTGAQPGDQLWAERSMIILDDLVKQIDSNKKPAATDTDVTVENTELKEPFESIYKTTTEIQRVTQAILS